MVRTEKRGMRGTVDSTAPPGWCEHASDEQLGDGPSDVEIEAWATRERQRREQYLKGPTPEQAALWASHERERRIAGLNAASNSVHAELAPVQSIQGYMRAAQLVAEGALSLLLRLSVQDVFDHLVQAGWDLEEQLTPHTPPGRRESADQPDS